MSNNKEKVSIIGFGIAGISIAIDLLDKGYQVDIFESKKNLGGRAGSINSGDEKIDIGQHIFLPSYTNFLNLLNKLDIRKKFHVTKKLNICVIHNQKRFFIKSNFPIYPVNIFLALINYKNLKFFDRIKLIFGLFKLSKEKNSDKYDSFQKWLLSNHQTEEMITKFWSVICKPAFNSELEKISTKQAINMFRIMIFDAKKSIGICYAKEPFSEILNDNLKNYFKDKGSNLFLGEKIKEIIKENDGYILKSRKNSFEAKKIVVATNLNAALSLGNFNEKNYDIEQNGIINIYFWFDKKVMNEEFIAFSNSKIEWVFSNNTVFNNNGISQRIVISLSSANRILKYNNKKITSDFEKELRKELRINKKTKTLKSVIIRSPKATQTLKSKLPVTEKENMFFVGDWTQQDLPNTMETAILSSKKLIETNF